MTRHLRLPIPLLLLALSTAPLAAGSTGAATDDPGAVLGRLFADAVNTDDELTRRERLAELYSPSTLESVGPDKLAAQVRDLRERFGLLELHHGELFSFKTATGVRQTLHVFARSRGAERWLDFQFRLDDGTPPRATQLVFVADVTEPVALPNGPLESPGTLDWLADYVDRLAREDDFSGSILLAVGDEAIFERTVGVADAAGRVPNTPATRFGMASGSKMFTALAVARLVEAGKLAWNTPLLSAVDGFPDSPRAREVTLEHLLTHTSGIGEYWTDEYEKAWDRLSSLKDTLPFVISAGFVADPGTEFRYSNSNFLLLGLAIEKATGKPYDEVLESTLFKPLGMGSTGFPKVGDPGIAAPLVPDGDGWRAAPKILRGTSAGGAYSTTHDLLRFARALVGGRIVKPETLALMTRSHTAGLAEALDYGYGFILGEHQDGPSFGHGGLAEGTDFDLEVFPAQDVTFILFGNRGAPAFDSLKRNTVRLITGER